jgi:hypothetical protein
MPRSERDIFNDHVTALLRQLGVNADDVADRHRRQLFDQARRRHLNDHEAALVVAHGHALDLLEENLERARVLVDRLALVAAQWGRDDLVNRQVVAPLERDARAALQRSQA